MRGVTVRLALVSALTTVAIACGGPDSEQFAAGLKRAVSGTPRWIQRDALGRRLWALEQKFYAQRGYVPAWIDGDDPTPQLEQLLDVLRTAELHGLAPRTYGYEALAAAYAKADEAWIGASFEPDVIPEVDARLTYAFLAHAADLLGWRSSPRQVDPRWLPAAKKADLLKQLREAIDGNKVRESLEALTPSHPQYKGLQAALARAQTGSADVDVTKIRMNLERWRWAPR
jgi:murein L,D-transpeptidase YcbB/YkuD